MAVSYWSVRFYSPSILKNPGVYHLARLDLHGSRFASAQTEIFSTEPCSKNAGETSIVFGLPFVSKEFQNQTEIEQHFGGFFHQIKVCQPIGRQDSMQTVIQTSRRVDFFFAWSGSELWSLSEYSRVKFENQNPIAVDVLFKAYPMVPLS